MRGPDDDRVLINFVIDDSGLTMNCGQRISAGSSSSRDSQQELVFGQTEIEISRAQAEGSARPDPRPSQVILGPVTVPGITVSGNLGPAENLSLGMFRAPFLPNGLAARKAPQDGSLKRSGHSHAFSMGPDTPRLIVPNHHGELPDTSHLESQPLALEVGKISSPGATSLSMDNQQRIRTIDVIDHVDVVHDPGRISACLPVHEDSQDFVTISHPRRITGSLVVGMVKGRQNLCRMEGKTGIPKFFDKIHAGQLSKVGRPKSIFGVSELPQKDRRFMSVRNDSSRAASHSICFAAWKARHAL